jgi:hypothetical protein
VELEVLGPNDVLKPVGEGVETRCVHVARARRPVNAIIIFSASQLEGVPCVFAIFQALSETDALAEVLAEVGGSRLVDAEGPSASASLMCSVVVARVAIVTAALVAISALTSGWLVMALATSWGARATAVTGRYGDRRGVRSEQVLVDLYHSGLQVSLHVLDRRRGREL